MSDEPVVVVGVVMPGPTLAPPYTTGDRCVVWLAASHTGDDANGGGIPFQLRADDGRELRIECAGASVRLPVRLRISYDGLKIAAPPEWRKIVDGHVQHPASREQQQSQAGGRLVSWLAVGDRVGVYGHLFEPSPFRGPRTMQAQTVQASGEPCLRTPALDPAEPETE